MSGATASAVVAGLAAAGAAVLLAPPRPFTSLRPALGARRRWSRVGLLAGPVLVGCALGIGVRGTHLAVALVGFVSMAGVLQLRARAREASAAGVRRQQVVDFCEALLGELQAGQPLTRALERSCAVAPETEPAVAAAKLGADVPAALRRLAVSPGARGLERLAGAWQICAVTGSGLAFAVEQVLETARGEQAVARLVEAELASARATARLVTALPVVVLLAAQGIGAEPWHFLLSTSAGVACLAGAVALAIAGLGWIDRIALAAVEGGR